MDQLAITRTLHVLAVVVWIGGVAMVTTITLPAARDLSNGADLAKAIERRFAVQARIATLLAGASGFYLVDRLDLWDASGRPAIGRMHAMVGVWFVFTVILFVAEPLFLHHWFEARARVDPDGTLKLVARLHWVLLIVSLITIFGAVAGSHGLFLF
jgi:uncharacterized membrane protein